MEIDDRDPWNYVQRSTDPEGYVGKNGRGALGSDPVHRDGPCPRQLVPRRAEQLNDMGRFEEAIADARKADRAEPRRSCGVPIELLWSYLSLEQEDKVRATIDELRSVADTWADAEAKGEPYRSIAAYYRQLKDFDRALAAVERAIETDPDSPWGFIGRMLIRRELGDAEGAKADCEAAARIDLDTPADLLSRGTGLLEHCGDIGGAIEDFNRVIALAPKWYEGHYFRRGMAPFYTRQFGKRDEALVDLNRAIELAPYSCMVLRNRLACLRVLL